MSRESKCYRRLTIIGINAFPGGLVDLEFQEELALVIRHQVLLEKFRIDGTMLHIGQELEIKGRKGNSNDDLYGIGTIEDIRVYRAE